tara:strand:- start:1037 stop:1936 length:900 start_codon:yes stop_codon:yes gene_type:complete
MRVVFYFILIFSFIESSFAQEVVVKQVGGNVEFVVGEKRTVVKDFSSFSEKSGVFILKDKNSQLFIRIGDKLDVLDFSEEKYKYPLKELIAPKQDLEKKEEGFLDKFFNIFSVSHDDAKINGMMVADKSGVSRSFNDTNIIFIETIKIMDGYPLKIDFSSSIDGDKIGSTAFNVLVKSKYSDRIIFDQTITETYFTINDTENNSLFLNWDIEINNINSSKKIKGTVESLYIESEKRKLFNQLKDKAIAESKTDESTYQIVFIESLRLSGLLANACYYLDLFIETNNNPKLINYKDHYTK